MKKQTLGKVNHTVRGFQLIEFKDLFNHECSIQQSSIALNDVPGTGAIWIGIDDPAPQCLHSDAKELGIETDATCGWVPVPISDKVMLSTRMHLDRDQVGMLIKHLQKWYDGGSFK
jgi:hypothetical protein